MGLCLRAAATRATGGYSARQHRNPIKQLEKRDRRLRQSKTRPRYITTWFLCAPSPS